MVVRMAERSGIRARCDRPQGDVKELGIARCPARGRFLSLTILVCTAVHALRDGGDPVVTSQVSYRKGP